MAEEVMAEEEYPYTERLLKLFLVKTVRDYFEAKGRARDEVLEYVKNSKTRSDIYRFVGDNMECCKYHSYVYKPEESVSADVLDRDLEGGERIIGGAARRSAVYLVDVTYEVMLRDPDEIGRIVFPRPVKVELRENGIIVVKVATLAKDINSYFPERRAKVYSEAPSEPGIVDAVLQHLDIPDRSSILDVTKGVKEWWMTDAIDSPELKYELPAGAIHATMFDDGNFREKLPERFDEEVVDAPLARTTMAVIKSDVETVDYFNVNPRQGRIDFPRMSNSVEETNYVLQEILRRN